MCENIQMSESLDEKASRSGFFRARRPKNDQKRSPRHQMDVALLQQLLGEAQFASNDAWL